MGRTSDAKSKLLRVAFQLIWQQSYGAVSVDDICQRAQVKKGSFYYFFRSKSDLAVAASDEYWRVHQPDYDRVFSPLVPPLDRIAGYCRMVYEMQRERHAETGRVLGCPFATVGCELSTQDENIRQKSADIFNRTCAYLEQALRDGVAAGQLEIGDFPGQSRAIFGLVMGMLLQARVRNDPEVLRELGPLALDMIAPRMAVC